ncbi:MAG: glycoside hydrolase family 31 protein [Oscillospiraceae bacterium]|nr:glycoside hydrolase family 31 protein [Oscillospiraceae bacterium]
MLTKGRDCITYRSAGQQIKVIPWGNHALRVLVSMLPEIPVRDWALLPQREITPVIMETEDTLTIRNGNILCVLDKFGRLTFKNGEGKVLLREYVRQLDVLDRRDRSPMFVSAREFKPIRGGDWRVTLRFEAEDDEFIAGMGQYQDGRINLKGCRLELSQRNSQATVPYLVSSRGYGFFWHNPAIGWVSFGNNRTEWYAEATDVIDYWICAGDTPAELVERYAAVTGTPPMMPEYGLGFWQCRLRYTTQEEVLRVAGEYHRRGIPLDVIIIDFFHWTYQGDWKFDPEYWPDPEGMVRELEAMGTKLMVSVWPTVEPKSENYGEMLERDLLLRTEQGLPVATNCMTNCAVVDTLNPEAREYLWDIIKRNYFDKGIGLFWLDVAEPEFVGYDYELYRSSRGPFLKVGNAYPQLYARAFYDGLCENGVENPVSLIRCAWAGSQRYGALAWSGDVCSTFESMQKQLCAGLSMAMSGIPWWNADIGGFLDGKVDDPYFRELLVRWFQWGTYCPVMRLHGQREPLRPGPAPDKPGGGAMATGSPNEIWSFGEEMCEIFAHYIHVRNSMRPYIRSLMRAAHETGAPVMRPLFYVFPEDAKAWDVKDAYMFGPDLLVAPVMTYGARTREVYLPAGTKWTEESTGKEYSGGQTVTAEAPLDVIPVFRKS